MSSIFKISILFLLPLKMVLITYFAHSYMWYFAIFVITDSDNQLVKN